MNSVMGSTRRVLKTLYRKIPAGGRQWASRILHGETSTQRKFARRVREARSATTVRGLAVPGEGDLVVGTVMNAYRAVVVTQFDADQHLTRIREAIERALLSAEVAVYRLPEQEPPVMVVSDVDWGVAWNALKQSDLLRTAWVSGDGLRGGDRPILDVAPDEVPPAIRVFQLLVSSDGDYVAGEPMHVRLESWRRVDKPGLPRPDGGTYEVGTLLCGGTYNTFASYLSPGVLETLRSGSPTAREHLPSVHAVTEPVDLVYTWVDGGDSAWLQKRARWSGEGFTTDAQIAARFESRDELRYSLRSVEMYANWFRTLYLVTDGQVPAWLNLEHPRLQVVDHRDIFTDEELPVFNSHAIEARLHHIEGLSERFIYLNDDVFFGRPVRPEQFFTGAGHLKYFPSRAQIDPGPRSNNDVSVTSAAKNNRAFLEEAVGRTITTKLKHTPHAHLKSVLAEMEERFPAVFAANVRARFRSHEDHSIVSGLAQRYGAATGRAVEGRITYNYADISREDISILLARWLRLRPYDAFCLNETGLRSLTEDQEDVVVTFLRRYFPLVSEFERD